MVSYDRPYNFHILNTRQRLEELFSFCTSKCEERVHLSPGGQPNFRLLYSSVEAFDHGSGVLLVGINPAGPSHVADSDDRRRPFNEANYCSYLDDEWSRTTRKERGRSPLQRAVQDVFMVLAGEPLRTVLEARRDYVSVPEERIGRAAEILLRNTPSGNIIPFRSGTLAQLDDDLRLEGAQVGWRLLQVARPQPRVIIALANGESDSPWAAIKTFSGHSSSRPVLLTVNDRLKRSYKEIIIDKGPLAGALLIGLPSLVRDKGRADVMVPLLEILHSRMPEIHGRL